MTIDLKNAKSSWIWLLIRLYLGWQWLQAGWHKLSGQAPFDAAGFIKGAIANSVPKTPGAKPIVQAWWASFLKEFALPHVGLFNFMVQWGEILVGLALIIGFATIFAVVMGMVMNFSFLLSGTISSSPNMLILAFILVAVGGAQAGYLGVDYWFRPTFRDWLARLTKHPTASTSSASQA